MMKRDENGKFVSETNYGFYSKLLNKPFDTLDELKAAEDEYNKAHNAELKAKEERQADVIAVQDAAKAYLAIAAESKAKREELAKAEQEAYEAYREQLNDFASKHSGYHLTYRQEGDNIEFKVEENRTKSLEDILNDQRAFIKKFWDGFYF